jgi:hypothetical protein
MDDKKMVTISEERYNKLLEKEETLERLEAYGVDNWEGYCDALNDTEGLFSEEE